MGPHTPMIRIKTTLLFNKESTFTSMDQDPWKGRFQIPIKMSTIIYYIKTWLARLSTETLEEFVC